MKSLLFIGIISALFNTAASLNYAEFTQEFQDILSRGNSLNANYSNLHLRDIPQDTPRDTRALIMVNNTLTSVADQFWTSDCDEISNIILCPRFSYLQFIDLSDNVIQNISSYSFVGLPHLKYLFLHYNRLETIPHNMFENNFFIQLISLSRNRIRYIDPLTFQNLNYLKGLFLERNMLTAIHCDLFRGLKSLITLYINDNYITHLSSSIFRNTANIGKLKINNNNLVLIPEQLLMYLRKLFYLDASHNKLHNLGKTFFSYAGDNITIYLNHNSIRKLSKFAYQNIAKLLTVDLSFNCLESVYLSRIPVSLAYLYNKTVISHDTGLCEVTDEDLPCFAAMDRKTDRVFHGLNFSYNNISEIYFGMYEPSHTMEFLNISLAGNTGVILPVSFIKQERYIIYLELDHVDVSWKNITLLNEILDLHHLKILSIIGCAACEYYMRQVLFSVFNHDLRVRIECGQEETSEDLSYTSTDGEVGNYSAEALQTGEHDEKSCPVTDGERNILDGSDSATYYPCHIFGTETIVNETTSGLNLSVQCDYTVDCSYVLAKVLPVINQSASCILLSHNVIEEVESNSFLAFGNLIYFDLSFNYLKYLHKGMFKNLHQLNVLKLNNNLLVYLNTSTFMGLSSLLVLTLHCNKISSYDPDTLAPMHQLTSLSIDFWNLTMYHEETFDNLLSLRALHMTESVDLKLSMHVLNKDYFNNLTNLEVLLTVGFIMCSNSNDSLFKIESLRSLKTTDGYLPKLSDKSFQIQNIKFLVLARNNILHLDKDVFGSLYKLVELDLSENKITRLHEQLFLNASFLWHLNLSHNHVSCIPLKIFSSLTSLRYLDLSFNMISNIAWETFSAIVNIYKIDLEGNKIGTADKDNSECFNKCMHAQENSNFSSMVSSDPPECFNRRISSAVNIYQNFSLTGIRVPNNPSLLFLRLKRNCVRIITGDAFRGSPSLVILDLSFNNVIEINEKAFIATSDLRMLNLSHNSLTSIRKNLLQNLTKLTYLNVENNALELIEEGAFRDLLSLQELLLGFNKLKGFDFNIFTKPNKLHEIYLNNNILTWLNTTNEMLSLKGLFLENNPSLSYSNYDFPLMPYLAALNLLNTGLCTFSRNSFQNLGRLTFLTLNGHCLRGLSPLQFSDLHRLLILNMRLEGTVRNESHSHLDWKNITLINYWFEMPALDYLNIIGQPICDDVQRTQIIENLFLSEKWKLVFCSDKTTMPHTVLSPDGKNAFILY